MSILIENIETHGFDPAIRGMRNPKNSWNRSDSGYGCEECMYCKDCNTPCVDSPSYIVGKNDLDLMQRLFACGSEHRKFDRMMMVSMDVTCNAVWWQEFDTYKVGTVRNSCSKMHKIHVKPFSVDDFSHEGIDEVEETATFFSDLLIPRLEFLRTKFNETGEKRYWRALLELLPHGYNMKATIMLNYETAYNIIRQREYHKWKEWRAFVKVLRRLPYMNDIIQKLECEEQEVKMAKAIKNLVDRSVSTVIESDSDIFSKEQVLKLLGFQF